MSPEYVRPYVKAQKHDRDAKAIAEAATRPSMRFVAVVGECPIAVEIGEAGVTGPFRAG